METEATPVPVVVPATPAPVEYKDITELTEKQDAHWRMTGELPKKEAKVSSEPKPAEKVPADGAEPATEADPEAPPQEQDPKPSKTGVGSMGHKELRARVRELEDQLAASKTAPKETSAPVEEPTAKTEKMRAKPVLEDKDKDGQPRYKNWEEYNEDLIDWKAEQKFTEYRKNEEKQRQEALIAQKNKVLLDSWNGRVTKASEKYADFAEVALDDKKGPGSRIAPGSVLDAWILDSDLGADILYHFGKDRNDLERIGALHPIAAARELAKLETKLSGEPVKTPTSTEPQLKTTKTPPPAREIGGRGSSAVDDVDKAVADDDVAAYMAAANRKALAALK
jgi:hypothetical protein